MSAFGVGAAVERKEDDRLLRGLGCFVDDLQIEGQVHAYVLRAPHAHARIVGVDTSRANTVAGVHAVFTGADLITAGIGGLPQGLPPNLRLSRRGGAPAVSPHHPLLAQGSVRHVGEPVAFVVADSVAGARNASELIEVKYRPLAATIETAAAISGPQIWEEAPDNIAYEWELGDDAAASKAIALADHVITLDLVNQRLVCNPLESRGALGVYDANEDRYTLYVNAQNVFKIRDLLATEVLHIDTAKLRVICNDVGGAFGMKGFCYAEHALVLWASKLLRRPVKWISDRGEAFVSDSQGRDHVTHAELATDKDGRFLGMKVSTIANLGAYTSQFGAAVPSLLYSRKLAGLYGTPAIHVKVTAVFTNTVPVDAYRGAGGPEAAYVLERLVDKAALELGLSPVEIRLRNLVPPQAMPYSTPTGFCYDSGDFVKNLEDALALADWDGFEERRQAARRKGKYRGIGLCTYFENTGSDPRESAGIRFADTGRVEVRVGTLSAGQGHATTFAQLLHERLGVPFDRIDIVEGDSDQLPAGGGTQGARSMILGGAAIVDCAEKVIERAREVAAFMLQAPEPEVAFEDGKFIVRDTGRSVGIMDVAATAHRANAPDGLGPGLDAVGSSFNHTPTFPNGCHVCELEIDVETGAVAIISYTAVDDFGRVVNPMIVAGQVHGGIAQGVGQALHEHAFYDPLSGQLITGSYMDYCLPRASDLPFIVAHRNEVPCKTNVLGVKGAGEAGTIGAPPAVINALLHALGEKGISDIDMPATPEKIWRALQQAQVHRPC